MLGTQKEGSAQEVEPGICTEVSFWPWLNSKLCIYWARLCKAYQDIKAGEAKNKPRFQKLHNAVKTMEF